MPQQRQRPRTSRDVAQDALGQSGLQREADRPRRPLNRLGQPDLVHRRYEKLVGGRQVGEPRVVRQPGVEVGAQGRDHHCPAV